VRLGSGVRERLGFGEIDELGFAVEDRGGIAVCVGVGLGDVERVGLSVSDGHGPHNSVIGAKIVIVGTHFVTVKVAPAE
jgi:hypothetical protein